MYTKYEHEKRTKENNKEKQNAGTYEGEAMIDSKKSIRLIKI